MRIKGNRMGYRNPARQIIRKRDDEGRGMDRERILQDLKVRTSSLRARIRVLDRRMRSMEHGTLPYPLAPVADPEKCVGCGLCERACPTGAIRVEETARVDVNRCLGCGICVDECPEAALTLYRLRPR